MLAYHNDPKIKANLLVQLARHREADEIVKGQYWENGKGCAVGCTIYSGNHAEYEPRFGIPEVLARLEDRVFEGLPNALAQTWPERFLSSISVGSDLSMVWPRFALWLMETELPQYVTKKQDCIDAIASVAALYREWIKTGVKPEIARWREAQSNAADAAADAAYAYAYWIRAADTLIVLIEGAPVLSASAPSARGTNADD